MVYEEEAEETGTCLEGSLPWLTRLYSYILSKFGLDVNRLEHCLDIRSTKGCHLCLYLRSISSTHGPLRNLKFIDWFNNFLLAHIGHEETNKTHGSQSCVNFSQTSQMMSSIFTCCSGGLC